jgi:hypothetical protein
MQLKFLSEQAAGKMAWLNLFQFGRLLATNVFDILTARVEDTAAGRIRWAGNIPLHEDPVELDTWIRGWYG